MIFFVFTLLFYISHGARPTCAQRTQTDYYLRNKGAPAALFYFNTRQVEDKCQVISNSEFRKQYSQLTPKEHVEHIIDINNGPSELLNCNKQIRGNMIIANGDWNRQVGQLCWKDVSVEKRLVYGDEIFNSAYDAVRSCCINTPKMGDIVGVVVAIVAGLTLSIVVVIIVNSYIRENANKPAIWVEVTTG